MLQIFLQKTGSPDMSSTSPIVIERNAENRSPKDKDDREIVSYLFDLVGDMSDDYDNHLPTLYFLLELCFLN